MAFGSQSNPLDELPQPGGSAVAPVEDDDTPDPITPDLGLTAGDIELVRLNLKEMLGDSVPSGVVTDFVNGWAKRLENLSGGTRVFANDLLSNSEFLTAAQWLPLWSTPGAVPPPIFTSSDGKTYTASFLLGIRPFDSGGSFAEIGAIPSFDLAGAMGATQQRLGRIGGGGGGSGSVGRQPQKFDRDQLLEAARSMWRSTLVDVDERQIAAAVDGFMREANSFWVKDGGSLDFETFVSKRIRNTTLYKQLYRNKPQGMTDAQYLGQAFNVVQAFPQLRPSQQTSEVQRIAKSGASAAGAATRLAGSETVQRGSPEQFTTAFARTIAGLGRAAQR